MAADTQYTIPSDALESWERRKNQRRLGGMSYDPREARDFWRGTIEAELGKAMTRRKLADDKAARDKALSLEEQRLANTKDYQDRSLTQNADQFTKTLTSTDTFRDKSLAQNADQFEKTLASTDKYRGQTLEAAEDQRKDAAEASLINAGLKGASLLASGLFSDNKKSGATEDGMSPLRKASDYFKRTLGGATPGSETGYTTGEEASYFAPDDTGNAFAMPASAPAKTAEEPAIGSTADNSGKAAGMYAMAGDVASDAYEPLRATNDQKAIGGSQNYADVIMARNPAIGEPVDKPDAPGMAPTRSVFETDTGLETTNAAEPGQPGGIASQAGENEGYVPPNLEDFKEPTFAPFTRPTLAPYAAPSLTPYTPPTLEPFTYNKPLSAFTEEQYRAEGGEYGRNWKEDKFLPWQMAKQTADKAQEQARYDQWAAEQNAKALSEYNTWANQQLTKSKADYDEWAKGENTKAEADYDQWKKNELEKAKADYEEWKAGELARSKKGYESGTAKHEAVAGSPWAYNTKRLGGSPTMAHEDYYGNQFVPAVATGEARTAEYEPMGAPMFEPSKGLPVAAHEAKAPVAETFSRFTESPTGRYTPTAAPSREADYEPINYEPAPGGSAPEPYESPYRYSASQEAFNYEPPPSFGGGTYEHEEDYLGSGGGGYDSGGGGGEGTIVCTELNRQGLLDIDIVEKDSAYRKKEVPDEAYAGYLALFGPVVRLMQRSRAFTAVVRPFGVAAATEMASRVDPAIEGSRLGKFILKVGVPVCRFVGSMLKVTEVRYG